MTAPLPEPEGPQLDDTGDNIFGVRRAGAGPRWQPGPPADLYADIRSAVSGHRLADEATNRQRANRSQRPPGQHAKDRSTATTSTRRRRIAIPRGLHKFWAEIRGKFWAACPSCGEFFGGHEWLTHSEDRGGHIATLWAPPDQPRPAICPACTRRGVGCLSYAANGYRHPGCPYLFALPQ